MRAWVLPTASPTLRNSHNRESDAVRVPQQMGADRRARGPEGRRQTQRTDGSSAPATRAHAAYLLDGARSDVSERERLERVGLLRRECIGHDRPAIGVQRVQRAGEWHNTIEWSLCHACSDPRERWQTGLQTHAEVTLCEQLRQLGS